MDEQKHALAEADYAFLRHLVSDYLIDPDILVTDWSVAPGCGSGDNYMSDVTRVTAKGSRGNGNDFAMQLIMKRRIRNEKRAQLFRCDEAFVNEISAYCHVLPALASVMESADGSQKMPYPRCLHANLVHRPDVVVLEDLACKKFKMADRLLGLDVAQCKLVMDELSKFHASSIALKKTNFNQFTMIKSQITDIVYSKGCHLSFSLTIESALNQAITSLDTNNNDGKFNASITSLERLRGNCFNRLANIITPQERFGVICHGDFWINNFLFNQNGEEVRFLDLQSMRYSSPCIDILHFIFSSTKTEVSKNYLNQLLRYYHEQLLFYIKLFLSDDKLMSKVRDELDFTGFKLEFERCLLYGLLNSFWLMPAVTFSRENGLHLDEVNLDGYGTTSKIHEDHIKELHTASYHQRIKELVEEYESNGWMELIEF